MDGPGRRVLQARRQPSRLDLHDGGVRAVGQPGRHRHGGPGARRPALVEPVERGPGLHGARQERRLPGRPGHRELLRAQLRPPAAHGRAVAPAHAGGRAAPRQCGEGPGGGQPSHGGGERRDHELGRPGLASAGPAWDGVLRPGRQPLGQRVPVGSRCARFAPAVVFWGNLRLVVAMPGDPILDSAFHIRWSELTPDRVEPSIDEAMGRAQAALRAIEGRAGGLTFENTYLALDEATDALNRAWSRVAHLESVADSPGLREAHNRVLPRVSAFVASIPLRPALWERLRAFADSPQAAGLTAVRARFVSETLAEFREAGAELPSDRRAGLEALQGELARLTQQFSENVLDGTNAWQLVLDDESRLAGLPSHAKDRARADASAKGFGVPGRPCWRFTLHMPSQEPFMAFVHDGALRREMWRAAVSVGSDPPRDNAALVSKILALRAERSGLLGKDHFADLVLGRRMAKTGARALEFNEDFRRRCSAAFARECRELEEWKARETGRPAAPLAPWETAYWAERLRRARYDFDEEELRPYFPMDRVVAGLFEIVRRVFGIRIAERSRGEVETWHPEVEFYDVFDAGSRHIGSFYSDWHPRESKRGGAWMSALITGGPQPDGARNPHLGLVCGHPRAPAAARARPAGAALPQGGGDGLPRIRPPDPSPDGRGRDQVAQRRQRSLGFHRAPVADHGELVLGARGARSFRQAFQDRRPNTRAPVPQDDGG